MKTILTLLALLALAIPVGADHCTAYSTAAPEIDTTVLGVDGLGYYLDVDFCVGEFCGFWVYEESNGIEGLQRDDELVSDTCHGMIVPDTIVL